VGSLFHDLPFARDANYPWSPPPPPAPARASGAPPQSGVRRRLMMARIKPLYNGLQVPAVQRDRHALFNTFYTFSKTFNRRGTAKQHDGKVWPEKYATWAKIAASPNDQRHVFGASVNTSPLYRRSAIARNHSERLGHSPIVRLAAASVFRHQRQRPTPTSMATPTTARRRPAILTLEPHGGAVVQHRPRSCRTRPSRESPSTATGAQHPYGPGYRTVDLALSRDSI